MNEPMLAWQYAALYHERFGRQRIGAPRLPAKIEYAVRRVGGLEHLEDRATVFLQAYNEAPTVDCDERISLQVSQQRTTFAPEEDYDDEVCGMQVDVPGRVPESHIDHGEEHGASVRDMRAGIDQPDSRSEAHQVYRDDCRGAAADGNTLAKAAPRPRARENWLRQLMHWIERQLA